MWQTPCFHGMFDFVQIWNINVTMEWCAGWILLLTWVRDCKTCWQIWFHSSTYACVAVRSLFKWKRSIYLSAFKAGTDMATINLSLALLEWSHSQWKPKVLHLFKLTTSLRAHVHTEESCGCIRWIDHWTSMRGFFHGWCHWWNSLRLF